MASPESAQPVAVVAGVGPGNGVALARRFAEAGYRVAMLARDLSRARSLADGIDGARAYACDVGEAAAIASAFSQIRADLGEVDVLIYNAGSGVFKSFVEVGADAFEQSWRVNALGAFLCAKEVVPAMQRKGAGAIVFIGATASRRGGPKTAAFAPAKAAQRSLAESMAKSLWPHGIHVALIIVDGAVETPKLREMAPDMPSDKTIDPAGVAEIAFQLTVQLPRAWSFEVEARPAVENW